MSSFRINLRRFCCSDLSKKTLPISYWKIFLERSHFLKSVRDKPPRKTCKKDIFTVVSCSRLVKRIFYLLRYFHFFLCHFYLKSLFVRFYNSFLCYIILRVTIFVDLDLPLSIAFSFILLFVTNFFKCNDLNCILARHRTIYSRSNKTRLSLDAS